MSDQSVNLNPTGPPETILDPEPTAARDALKAALALPPDERRDAVGRAVVRWPRYLEGWAQLGALATDDAAAYAAFRVGYHRGLDRLRQNGWRGSGYVRWHYPENRGFLRSLHGLEVVAARIGEHDEEERCRAFLHQCDPGWPPEDLD
ncbi:MAG: DUF3151 family protein [Acidimicrobiales bacterium]